MGVETATIIKIEAEVRDLYFFYTTKKPKTHSYYSGPCMRRFSLPVGRGTQRLGGSGFRVLAPELELAEMGRLVLLQFYYIPKTLNPKP